MALHNSSCCTFNVGTISASNSSDRIADHAEIEIEIRSHDPKVLKQISEELFSLVEESIKEENGHWNQHGDGKLSAKIEKTGDRPASSSLEDSPVLTASYAAMLGLGIELRRFDFGATDQNIPLSMGIPATTHGAGGSEDFGHSLKEKWDSSDAYLGPQLTFLTAVSLVGLNNITKPILQKRPYRNTAFSRNIYSN